MVGTVFLNFKNEAIFWNVVSLTANDQNEIFTPLYFDLSSLEKYF